MLNPIISLDVTISEDPDCCAPPNSINELTITVEDGGGGPYIVLYTTRWAIESKEEFGEILDSVMEAHDGILSSLKVLGDDSA